MTQYRELHHVIQVFGRFTFIVSALTVCFVDLDKYRELAHDKLETEKPRLIFFFAAQKAP